MNYEHVKELLEEHGELIVTTESGDRYELHLGDVVAMDSKHCLYWDAGTSKYLLDGTSIEAVEVHSSDRL